MTIGEKINQLTTEYIDLYNKFVVDPNIANPDALATLDLENKIFIYQQTLVNVKTHIENKVKEKFE